MTAWTALNSTVRFLLKLCALLALMYWGIHTGDSMAEGIVIGASLSMSPQLVADDTSSWVGLPTDDVRCESARRTATRLPMSLIEDAGQLQRITDALKQSSMLETGPPSRSELAASGHGKHVLLAKMSRSNYIPGKRHLSCSEGRRSLIGKAELEIKYCVT